MNCPHATVFVASPASAAPVPQPAAQPAAQSAPFPTRTVKSPGSEIGPTLLHQQKQKKKKKKKKQQQSAVSTQYSASSQQECIHREGETWCGVGADVVWTRAVVSHNDNDDDYISSCISQVLSVEA